MQALPISTALPLIHQRNPNPPIPFSSMKLSRVDVTGSSGSCTPAIENGGVKPAGLGAMSPDLPPPIQEPLEKAFRTHPLESQDNVNESHLGHFEFLVILLRKQERLILSTFVCLF